MWIFPIIFNGIKTALFIGFESIKNMEDNLRIRNPKFKIATEYAEKLIMAKKSNEANVGRDHQLVSATVELKQ